MPSAIDFYFDFSSPYGYLATFEIDALAARHGREVNWRPYLMGAAMKQTGSAPLSERPLISDYAIRDFKRSARKIGAPFEMPDPFPVATVAPCRAFYWLHDVDAENAKALARALYAAFFAQGRNISDASVVVECAAELGVDADTVTAALSDQKVKDRLRAETEGAIERGAFGSPFFFVDGEPFWGHDRMAQIDEWLVKGGW